jgi:diketogulonate reductase-like aldo/keto reductase
LQALVKNGKARAIGVSNFSISELVDLIPYEDYIPISCNHIEVHLWLQKNELIAFAREKGILTTSFFSIRGSKEQRRNSIKG